MAMANGGRGPEREWATLALTSLGALVACLVVVPEHGSTPWYLTVAMATAAAVFVVAAAVLVAQPLLRRRRSAPPP
jgi:peptidoglycan/LPS O-acetylase OafA/YrhL